MIEKATHTSAKAALRAIAKMSEDAQKSGDYDDLYHALRTIESLARFELDEDAGHEHRFFKGRCSKCGVLDTRRADYA